MFTVKNTLIGAIVSAAGVMLMCFWKPSAEAFNAGRGPLAALLAMNHVWWLLGHLRLKDRVRQGKPGVWPAPSE